MQAHIPCHSQHSNLRKSESHHMFQSSCKIARLPKVTKPHCDIPKPCVFFVSRIYTTSTSELVSDYGWLTYYQPLPQTQSP